MRHSQQASGLALAVMLLTGLLATGGASSAAAKAPVKVTVQLAWLMNDESAGIAAAVKQGFYRQAGLDVTVKAGGPSVDPVVNVASGQAQFGVANSSGDLMLAAAQGIPVKAVAATYQKHPFAFFYLPGTGITRPADLRGKKIGIQATARYLLEAFLFKVGVPLKDVTVVTIGSNLVPLAEHQVAAASAWVINAGQTAAVPRAKYFLTYNYGLEFTGMVLFTTSKEIATRPAVVKAFVHASMQGWAWAMSHPKLAVRDVMDMASGLSEPMEYKTLLTSIPLIRDAVTRKQGLGYMLPSAWEQGEHILVDTHQLKKMLPIDRFFTNRFIAGNTPKE